MRLGLCDDPRCGSEGVVARRIGYVVKRFPRLSETFVLEEMLGLEERGFELVVYAIADPREPIIDGDVKRLKANINYLTEGYSAKREGLRIFLEHLRLMTLSPRSYYQVVRALPMGKDRRAWFKNVAYGIILSRLIRLDEIDHIHGAFAHSPSSAALVAAQISGTTFSMAGHAKDIVQSSPLSLRKKVEMASFVLLCSSKALKDVAQKSSCDLSGHGGKLKLLRHGVDLDKFRPDQFSTTERSMIEDDVLRLVTVGRLVPKKGYGDLIDALAIVQARGRSFNLRMVGDGPLRQSLEEKASLLGIRGRITFLGSQDRQGVINELSRSSVFVHPSVVLPDGDSDGIPNVLLEAMACGKVVVGADIDGIKEAIEDRISGRIYRSGDVRALAKVMIELIDDRETLAGLANRARGKVEMEFSKDMANDMVAELMAAVAPRFDDLETEGEIR